MTYTEKQIRHEEGDFFVLERAPRHYALLENVGTHSFMRGVWDFASSSDKAKHVKAYDSAVFACKARAGSIWNRVRSNGLAALWEKLLNSFASAESGKYGFWVASWLGRGKS